MHKKVICNLFSFLDNPYQGQSSIRDLLLTGVCEVYYGAGCTNLTVKSKYKTSDSVRKWERCVSGASLRAFDLAEDMEGSRYLSVYY